MTACLRWCKMNLMEHSCHFRGVLVKRCTCTCFWHWTHLFLVSRVHRQTPPPAAAAMSNGGGGGGGGGKPNAWSRPLQPKQKQTTTTGPPPGMGAPPVLRERFLHLTLSMVGQRVVLVQTDGTTFEGIFHTFTPFTSTDIKYVLKACSGEGVETGATVILDAANVAHVHVKSMRLDTKQQQQQTSNNNGDASFQTDVQISGSKHDKNRDLVAAGTAWTTAGTAWTTAGGGSSNLRAESLADRKGLKGNIGEWDQFKANEELFSVQATFDENLYTTELDHSQIDGRKRMEAARLAKEIEGTASSNIHIAEERGHKLEGDFDEEDRYSGVLKPSLQPRNVDPKDTAKPAAAAAKPAVEAKDAATKEEEPAKPTAAGGPKKMNYAAAAAKADAKAAVPPGFVKATAVTPGEDGSPMKKDEKKEEENVVAEKTGEDRPVPVTPTAEEGKAKKEEEKTDEKADGAKAQDEKTEKKPATKLNANAKAFSFNPSAKSFTPTFGGAPPAPVAAPLAETYPIDPNTGMPMVGPGAPQQMPAQYMPHPGMAQPGKLFEFTVAFSAVLVASGC